MPNGRGLYIGHDSCVCCGGHDKAELYAGEVTKIQNHLASQANDYDMGDRLIDGKTTGIGAWEASMNNTYRAIDLIPKDVSLSATGIRACRANRCLLCHERLRRCYTLGVNLR